MVTARCLPYMGGIETHVDEVARRIAGRGVALTVLSTDVAGGLPSTEHRDGYLLRRFPAYPRSKDYYLSPNLLGTLARLPVDVVHVQGAHTGVPPLALSVAHARRLPAVCTFHTGGYSSETRNALRETQWRVEAPLLRRCARLVAVCSFERDAFARRLGIAPERIEVIRNGCEPLPVGDPPPVAAGAPLLCSIGRLERYKGHHRVIEAMPHVLDAAPGARLVVAGAGPYEAELRGLIERLGLDEAVTIERFGTDRRGELGALVARSDAVALLSEYEAHPVALMEALAAGVDVVAAATSGMTELGRAGLVDLVEADASDEAVAATLLRAAESRRWSAGPPALPTWDDCADRLAALYEEIARTAPLASPRREVA